MYRRCGFRYEKKLRAIGAAHIAGIDEAGRGALAGPVVAAAVILPEKFRHRRLNDSKQLAPELREEIYHALISNPDLSWAVGIVDSVEIDRINILRATHKAMRVAIAALSSVPDHVLIDGLPVIPFPFPQTAIIDGDCLSLTIAAASVIAKVVREKIMAGQLLRWIDKSKSAFRAARSTGCGCWIIPISSFASMSWRSSSRETPVRAWN